MKESIFSFARVLFNYDLPWNPMDLEQRIGRIHRYGQQSTAQVYNLVAADTIEGQIFLILEDKLSDIAQTLGKVDDQGTDCRRSSRPNSWPVEQQPEI